MTEPQRVSGDKPPQHPVADRVAGLDWEILGAELDDSGFAITEPLLEPGECSELAGLVIFPTRELPNRGAHGYHRVGLRHGVSTVTEGTRTALGSSSTTPSS